MTLADSAYARIRQDVVNGTLLPDHPLRLDALKARYGIGYSPLREALNRLQSERIVVAVPLRGFTVAPVSLEQMWDVIETRIHIESRALALSMQHGDDAWESEVVSAMHALLLQARRLADQRDVSPEGRQKLEDRHRSFHRALIAACRSEWLLDFSAKLYVASERYRHTALTGTAADGSQRDLQAEHRLLAETAIARDAPRALELLKTHYQETGRHLERSMRQGSEGAAAADGPSAEAGAVREPG
ncbi:GntR family transcriptional regulator [Paracoccus jeotgali]|uniref:GntR family transcriptional regulator n=1 Tax=Paracoccus jeotgali TaxID=2065379 RepID=UPI0028AC1887|nr:GntR family transcriptional regulator [Paracoccus jeotgali]